MLPLPLLLVIPAFVQTVPPDASELPGPWERMLESHRAEQYPWPTWRLLSRVPINAEALRTEPVLRLLSSGELGLTPYSEKDLAAFWKQNDWGQDVDWVLLSPDGSVATKGATSPLASDIEGALSKSAWKSRGRRIADFTKGGKGSGEAWGDALVDAGRLLLFIEDGLKEDAGKPLPWWVWEAPAPDPRLLALKEKAELEGGKALDGLRLHNGYERWPGLSGALSLAPDTPNPTMSDALRPVIGDIVQELHRTPQSEGLWTAWSQVARRLPKEVSEFTPYLFAVPQGDPWPPPAGLRAVLQLLRARGDQRLLLAFCRNQLQAPIPGTINTEVAWHGERMQRIQSWGLPGLAALMKLKAESDGLVWIEELRRLWGKEWDKSDLRSFLLRIDRDWLPESWDKAISSAPLEDPPLPQHSAPLSVPYLALDSQNDRSLEKGWRALRDSPALDAWGPGDLGWKAISKEQLKHVREDFGLDASPRWFLFQGSGLIASGTSVPVPAYIQARLRNLGAPRLETLNQFLAQYPDQKEAHLERFQLLRERLPQLRLEPDLLKDAVAALLPVGAAGAWSPSGDAWAFAAKQMLPRLEEKLRQWPSDLGTWRTWISWSELSPDKPKALNLAKLLEPWPGLRFEAAQLIAGQLRNRGDWKALEPFARDHWDNLVEQARPIHIAIPQLEAHLANELEVWLSFLEEALAAQGQASSAKPLRAQFKELTLRKPPGK